MSLQAQTHTNSHTQSHGHKHALARLVVGLLAATTLLPALTAYAAPSVSRLTPPSEQFSSGQAAPVIARFLPGQRFDLQATLRPDGEGKTISSARFMIDGKAVNAPVALLDCASGCLAPVPKNAAIATVRAVSVGKAGLHTFSVTATQSDSQTVTANGNFEVVPLLAGGQKAKNIIILLGDGMGAAQRTAARIVAGGYAQGKVITPLAMDTFPVTGMVKTASLNSVVTDSALPGAIALTMRSQTPTCTRPKLSSAGALHPASWT